MSSSNQFWVTQEDWSKRKHLILRYYLKPAAAKLASVSPNRGIIIIDGFAGRGRYEDGSPGSPIHVAEVARDCYKFVDPVFVSVRNIEANKQTFRELENATEFWRSEGIVRNINKTLREALPEILSESIHEPLFAFLDPFAPSQLPVNDFTQLLRRKPPTEALIVLHTPAIVRMVRQYAKSTDIDVSQRLAYASTLSQVFGSVGWRALEQSSCQADDVVTCYENELKDLFPAYYVYSHAIRARVNSSTKYHIVFLTKNLHGVSLMNDAFVKENQALTEDTTPSPQTMLDLYGAEMWESLCTDILDIGRSKPVSWRRQELVFASIAKRFGEFRAADHLKAIKELMDRAGAPRIVPVGLKTSRSGSWRTNDDTNLMFDFETATSSGSWQTSLDL